MRSRCTGVAHGSRASARRARDMPGPGPYPRAMTSHNTDAHTLALTTIGKVLGPVRARMLLDSFLARRDRDRLESADDLLEFGRDLCMNGGTEENLGAQLCLQASRMGATDNGE
jgi:hypothetical protein